MSRWPLHKAYFWEQAPFFRLLLPLVLGIVLYDVTARYNYAAIFSIGVASLILFGGLSFVRKQFTLLNTVRFLFVHLAIIALGWLLSYCNDIRNEEDWFGKQQANASVVRIVKAPAEKPKTWKLIVDVIGAVQDGKIKPTKGKGFVYVYKNVRAKILQEGDTIIIPANWQPVKNAGNPYEFDYAGYCARNNIYCLQFLSPDNIVLA